MLVLYPRLSNGNILWTCDNCGDIAQVSFSLTNAVALYCICSRETRPRCNADWYNKGLYWERIPMEDRMKNRNE